MSWQIDEKSKLGRANTNQIARGAYQKAGFTIEVIEYSQREQARTVQEMTTLPKATEESSQEMNTNLNGTAKALNTTRAFLRSNKIYESPSLEDKQFPLMLYAIGLVVS